MKSLLRLLIRFYQRFLSPLFHYFGGPGSGCRFFPTCSHYALEAIERHSAIHGSWLSLKRLGRCHPWGGCGHDPVPPVLRASISKNIKSPSSTPAWIATL